jgi:hypothetical protein
MTGERDPVTATLLRAALIRLLWREVADGGGCVCDDGDPRPTDTCAAMRALEWGEHWDAEVFQRNATDVLQDPEALKERAAKIETNYLERKPMRKLALVRKPSNAQCFLAATDDGREPPEVA